MAAGKKGKAEGKSQAKGDGPKGAKGKGGKNAADDAQKTTKVKGAQHIHIRHILCDKHSKKEEALALLKGEGKDFATVAKTYSLDKPNQGGNLGKHKKGDLFPEFWDVAIELPILNDNAKEGSEERKNYPYGEVKTSEGYHIIMVYKRE